MKKPQPEGEIPSHDSSLDLNREILLDAINRFLNREMSQDEICHWAFNCGFEDDFGHLAEIDPLVHDIIVDLIKLNDQSSPAAFRRKIQKYRRYLLGEKRFDPLKLKSSFVIRTSHYFLGGVVNFILFTLRLYVVVFALCSLVVNYLLIKNPQILYSPKGLIPYLSVMDKYCPYLPYPFIYNLLKDPEVSRFLSAIRPQHEIIQVYFLHMTFAIFALLPPAMIVRSVLFTVALPFLGLGMFYYWYIAYDVSVKMASLFTIGTLNAYLLAVSLIAIPATLALILLLCKNLQFQLKEDK